MATWTQPDLIIGIGRGGVPLSVAISYLAPSIPITFATRKNRSANSDPFYVFKFDYTARLRRPNDFIMATPNSVAEQVLIVDDVATFGSTLEAVSTLAKEYNPQSHCSYFCFAVDRPRLSQERPKIAMNTKSFIEIDNKEIWIKMPWQISS